jgi:hypothetical protein
MFWMYRRLFVELQVAWLLQILVWEPISTTNRIPFYSFHALQFLL